VIGAVDFDYGVIGPSSSTLAMIGNVNFDFDFGMFGKLILTLA